MFQFVLAAIVVVGGMVLLGWLSFSKSPGRLNTHVEVMRMQEDLARLWAGVQSWFAENVPGHSR